MTRTRVVASKDGGVVTPFTAEEEAAADAEELAWSNNAPDRAMKKARKERNIFLAESDWTQMVDYSGADKEAWATYRQALRDLPQTYTGDELIQSIANRTDLVNPVDDGKWPTKPGT